MYPASLLQWLGMAGIVLGVLVLVGMVAWWVSHRYDRWERRRKAGRKDEDGRTAVWLVFEALSAVFVVTGLLVAIYSDSQVLRAIAGVAMIVLVSAATTAVVRDR